LRCITHRTTYASRSDEFNLYIISDTHLGSKHSDEALLRRVVAEIKSNPHNRWLGLGDYGEYINMKDPRFDPSELASWLFGAEELSDVGRAQSERFITTMEPVKEQCLALVCGNHEDAILHHSDHDVYSRIIDGMASGHELRLGHGGFLTWRFKRENGSVWSLPMFLTHGSGGGQSGGNVGNKLEKLVRDTDGVQVVIMGHHHDPGYRPFARLKAGRKEAEVITIHAISAPAMSGYMEYAQARNARPRPTGYCVLTIAPDKKTVSVNLRVQQK